MLAMGLYTSEKSTPGKLCSLLHFRSMLLAYCNLELHKHKQLEEYNYRISAVLLNISTLCNTIG